MHVLVADDDPILRRVISAAVEHLGHRCSVAVDGDEAWRIFQAGDVEVLITDWEMPGMDGTELAGRIRAMSGGAYPYIMLLTGRADEGSALATMLAGADDYATKPLSVADLQRKLVVAERVTAMHKGMHNDARQDPLTQIGNRLRLSEDLVALSGRVVRYGHAYSLALLDIDHFKSYNDLNGHVEGDAALRAVAGVLAEQARDGDSLYRYGGEEFLILLPEQSLDSAALAAERLRAAVRALAMPHPAGGFVTVSAGVASLGGDRTSPEQVLELADQALYRAKAGGRDRVELSPLGVGVGVSRD